MSGPAVAVLALSLAACVSPPTASPQWLHVRAECQEEAALKLPTNTTSVVYDSYVMGCMKARGLDSTQPN